ncbi:MAG: hypothetical protein Q7S47_00490 [bacterium]|nr:hypothetical protein [bacterium]
MNPRNSIHEKGTITLEIIIAFGLFALCIGSIVVTHYSLGEIVVDTSLDQHALYRAHDALQRAQGLLQGNFTTHVSSTSDHAPYHEEVTEHIFDSFTKRIDVTEQWSATPLRPMHITLSTLVTDRTHALGTAPCLALASNNTQLTLLGSLSIGSANYGTDIKIIGNRAYLTTGSPTNADPDFFIIDTSDSAHPFILGNLNIGSSQGIAAITIHDSYAFVATMSLSGQLKVIDINDSTNPHIVASLKLPGVSGNGIGNSIAYEDDRIYLGTQNGAGPVFHIIDVSDPLVPHELGSWDPDTIINGITPRGDRVYVSTGTDNQLRALDISNPANPVVTATFTIPSAGTSNSGQESLLVGSTLYFARNRGTNSANDKQLYSIDTTQQDTFTVQNSIRIGASIYDMVSHTGHLVLATKDATNDLQLWDTRDPVNPSRLSTLNLPATPIAIACDDTYLYSVLSSNSPTLQIIGLSQ